MTFYENNKQGIWVAIILLAIYYFFLASPDQFAEESFVDSGFRSVDFAESVGFAEGGFADNSQIRQSAYATLESKEYDSDKDVLTAVPEQFDGYFTNQNENKYKYEERDFRTFYFTFKVPKDNFQEAIESVKSIADVQNINVNADDVSTQYEDNERILNNFKKERTKLESLLDETDEVSDIIQIQTRLGEVQRQIDFYEQRILNLDRQTKFSQISVTLHEERPVSVTIFTTFKEHWENFLTSIDDLLAFITSYILYIVLGLIAWFWWKKQ